MGSARRVLAFASLLMVVGCSSALPRAVTTSPSPTASPVVSSVAGSPADSKPSKEGSVAPPDGLPSPAEPTAACLMAFTAWEKAGADTLEPDDKAVVKTLNACSSLAEWLGGLRVVPAALGYSSPSELNDTTVLNDLQIICGNAKTKVCRNAVKLGVLT